MKNNFFIKFKKISIIILIFFISIFLLWFGFVTYAIATEKRPVMTYRQFNSIVEDGIKKMEKDSLLTIDDCVIYCYIYNTIDAYEFYDAKKRYSRFQNLLYSKHDNLVSVLDIKHTGAGGGIYSMKYDVRLGGRMDYQYTVFCVSERFLSVVCYFDKYKICLYCP